DIKTCSAGSNAWGASFDDGPSPATPIVLDYFKSVNAKATFWVIGSNVVKHPEILLSTYQAGHDIGIHTYSHPHLPSLPDDQVVSELIYAAKAVLDVLGVYPKYFRPPYGDIDDRVRGLAKMAGLTAVTWSSDSKDWSFLGQSQMGKVPATFKNWMDQGLTNGISLQHDYYP
ncbi:hypothetical protein BDR26DRAFT_796928, partial [Obelidium mucronatum]